MFEGLYYEYKISLLDIIYYSLWQNSYVLNMSFLINFTCNLLWKSRLSFTELTASTNLLLRIERAHP